MIHFGRVAVVIVMSFSATSSGQEPPDRQQMIEGIFAQRERIKSYHLRFTVEMNAPHPSAAVPIKDVRKFEIWHAGQSTRTEQRIVESNYDPAEVGGRRVQCRNCEKEGHGVVFTITKTGSTPVEVLPLDKFASKEKFRTDWRLIGLFPGDVYASFDRDPRATLRLLASDKRSVLTPVANSEIVLRLNEGPAHREFTLASEFDHNPTRFAMSSPESEVKFEVEYQKVNEISFPKSITLRQSFGKKPPTEQKITFELVELNLPIDPSVFTVAGMQLPDGLPVELPDRKKSVTPTWRDGKLDYEKTMEKESVRGYIELKEKAAAAPIADIDPNPPWLSRSWPYLAAAGLSLLAWFLLRGKVGKSKE